MHDAEAATPPSSPSETAKLPDDIDALVRARLKDLDNRHRRVLVTIPVWGWVGDGKTTGILTAVHYSSASVLFDLSPVTNSEDLSELESARPEYEGLGLAAVAQDSNAGLARRLEQFIDGAAWVPGTEEPSSYILGVRTSGHILGYAVLPDIRGGSFEENDDIARAVLAHPSAAVMLINVGLHKESGTKGRKYRAAVLHAIQRFAQAKVPLCVMLTQMDRYGQRGADVDHVQAELTALLGSQEALDYSVFRVSAVGQEPYGDGKTPPPADKRDPATMMRAWYWVFGKALLRSDELILAAPPTLDLEGSRRQALKLSTSALPELRQIGDYSGGPGAVLCSCGDSPSLIQFLFVAKNGDLFEVSVPATQGTPGVSAAGSLGDWKEVADLDGIYRQGRLFIGPRRGCNAIWTGLKGQTLDLVALPAELVSWSVLSGRRLVGVDASGRLHSVEFEAAKAIHHNFLGDFVPASPISVCAVHEAQSLVVVHTGNSVEAVRIENQGFGDRVTLELASKFDTTRAVANHLGLCAGISKTGQVTLSAPKQPLELGPVANDTMPIALAPDAAVLGTVAPDLRLAFAMFRSGKLIRSGGERSPLLRAAPSGLAWDSTGQRIVVTYPDGRWNHFRVFGADK